MDMRNTVLSPVSLYVLAGGFNLSFAALLSAARSEYLAARRFDGPFMTRFTGLMRETTDAAYAGGAFKWSRYNIRQWEKFVASDAATPEGGSCVFSCEPDGDYNELNHNAFRAMFIGVPTGMWPYHVSIRDNLAKMTSEGIRAWITARGFATV